ncbi:hypothetical protein [Vibrio sp. WXL103]|uniref:hypothetical protein n=1 Tax=unclassified Vibrio TaxID=2614977 RepID=UPI003EC80184
MESVLFILNLIIGFYFIVGSVATLYIILMFFFTGHNVFDAPTKPDLPFAHKVSYVLVMFFMFPVFYGVFFKETLKLWSNVKLAEKA